MKIDQFKPAIVYTIYIAATPEKVWQALTTAEFSRQYFSGHAVEVDFDLDLLRLPGALAALGVAFAGRPGEAPNVPEIMQFTQGCHICYAFLRD